MDAHRVQRVDGLLSALAASCQRQRFLAVAPCAKAEGRFTAVARGQLQRHLDRRAGIQARTHPCIQTLAPQRCRCVQAAVAADELQAITGPAAAVGIGVEEGHPAAEIGAVGVSRQQRPGLVVAFSDHVHARLRAQVTHHPFDVADGRQPPCPARQVVQAQDRELQWRGDVDEYPQFAGDAVLDMLVHCVAESMPCTVGPGAPAWQRHRRPHTTRILIAHVEGLATRVRHRIIEPGRQAEFVRILEPRIARCTLTDDRAQAGVRDHIGPWRRRRRVFAQHHDVLAAVLAETAGTVVELAGAAVGKEGPRVIHVLVVLGAWGQAGVGARIGDDGQPRRRLRRQCQFLLHCLRHQGRDSPRRQGLAADLSGKGAVLVADNRPRHRLQQDAVLVGHVLHRPHENAARAIKQARLRTGGHHPQNLVLQFLPIAGLAVVPDDQVGVEALLAPVRMRLHQLPDQFHVVRVGDLEQHDGQVARDRMAPQPGLSALVLQQDAGTRAQQ
ncbi:hypothetical protein D3C81_720270 [compost metagenome]